MTFFLGQGEYVRQALWCTVVSTSRHALRSGCCFRPAKHGAVEGNDVHGGHDSGGHDLHDNHSGGHGEHRECRRSSGLG
jgi:hypothetical protein